MVRCCFDLREKAQSQAGWFSLYHKLSDTHRKQGWNSLFSQDYLGFSRCKERNHKQSTIRLPGRLICQVYFTPVRQCVWHMCLCISSYRKKCFRDPALGLFSVLLATWSPSFSDPPVPYRAKNGLSDNHLISVTDSPGHKMVCLGISAIKRW